MTERTFEVHTCFSTHRGFVKQMEFRRMAHAYLWIANEVAEWKKDNFNIDVASTYKIVVRERILL